MLPCATPGDLESVTHPSVLVLLQALLGGQLNPLTGEMVRLLAPALADGVAQA